MALTNVRPFAEFSVLIPKLVYSRYEIAPVLRKALSSKFTNFVFTTS